MDSFRVLDHDADIRLEIYGASMEELFHHAAVAIFSLITDPVHVEPALTKEITVSGNGELLINFLNELLFIWDVERFIPVDASVSFHAKGLTAVLKGEVFNENRHVIEVEMKAVTYHAFAITEENGKFKANIIIDV
ncbi:MAG: archease [Syntrophorhabdaceae bacterium]|nr:archease [Syntrophorhabdaceae bacterium]